MASSYGDIFLGFMNVLSCAVPKNFKRNHISFRTNFNGSLQTLDGIIQTVKDVGTVSAFNYN